MLNEMEERLCHRMDSVKHELKGDIGGVKSELHGIKSEIQGIKSEIHGIKSEIHGIKSDVHGVKSELHRVALLVEEQNARNKYVMDGYAQLYDLLAARQGR